MAEEKTIKGKAISRDELLENARWMLGTASAASFASLLVVLGVHGTNIASNLEWASVFFVVAIPLMGQYLFATGKTRELHVVTELMRWLAVFGMLFFALGFSFLLATIHGGLGVLWMVLVILMALLLMRAEKLRARAGATEDQSAT